MTLPSWLRPVVEATQSITVHELTRFQPPEGSDARPGAVLMLFSDRAEADPGPDDPQHRGELLLTERAHDMRSHPGHVSFPGGSVDPGETAVEAALREAEEEIGLPPAAVEVIGRLSEALVVTSGFRLTPWVGVVPYPYPYVAQPEEVAGLVELPVAGLLAPGSHRVGTREAFGMVHEVHTFEVGGETVWGASARILHELLVAWRGR